jgi:hypothetical protein
MASAFFRSPLVSPVLLVEVFDLIWLVARDPAPVWLADFRLVVCHWVFSFCREKRFGLL